ncbi:hypothetical protein K7432_018363, partial [Basidiobolus ranarum]
FGVVHGSAIPQEQSIPSRTVPWRVTADQAPLDWVDNDGGSNCDLAGNNESLGATSKDVFGSSEDIPYEGSAGNNNNIYDITYP